MADITEKTGNGELVTNRDQLVVVDNIESLIKVIRGQQVMLDRDLATLYGVETKRLNEQVKRNIKRFPEDFMFQLTKDECLRSQIATLNEGRGQHLKYMPYVFTENGVAMLSSVLRSDTAIEVNIRIMRAFHFKASLSTEQCRSVSASLDYGIPSIGNATTLARIRQAYRRSVSQIGRGQRKAEAGCVITNLDGEVVQHIEYVPLYENLL